MKKILSVLLAAMLIFSLAACGEKPQENADPTENQIRDGAGRILDIPENPEEATIASVYGVAVPFFVALGLTDRVKAVNVKTNFWKEADAGLAKAGTVGRGVVDLEALATYAPTALVHRSNDPETVEAVNKLGIDVLCITVENVDDIKNTLTIMAKYFGAEDRCQTAIDWIEGKFDMIADIVATIPEEERVTAMLMGGEEGRVAGNDMLQSWMIEQAGGKCVVTEGKDHNWIDVGVEKVFEWNPEFLFCTGSTGLDYSPEGLLADKAWSAVTAIQNKNVFIIPARIDAWDIPGISACIGTMYMLHKMYPDYFSAEQLQNEIDEYYTFMFGKTFTPDYLGYDLENE